MLSVDQKSGRLQGTSFHLFSGLTSLQIRIFDGWPWTVPVETLGRTTVSRYRSHDPRGFCRFRVHVALGGAFEARTVGAMLLRSIVWIAIAVFTCRALGCFATTKHGDV